LQQHLLSLVALLVSVAGSVSAQSSGYPELDAMVQTWKEAQQTTFGYPASQESNLAQFYQWYLASGMNVVNLNNAGDPMTDDPSTLSTQKFERQVIEFFAPLYGFKLDVVDISSSVSTRLRGCSFVQKKSMTTKWITT